MEYLAILQARTGSTRMPNKMITRFYGDKTLLEVVLDRIKQAFSCENIVVATTRNSSDDEICDICTKSGIKSYRGDENDVLSRFIEVGELYQTNNIIRICADNPFIDINSLKELKTNIINSDSDYISYRFSDGTPIIKSHIGLFAEALKLNALKKVSDLTNISLYREHVTNFIYEHDNLFKVKFLDVPMIVENKSNIRLTLDTIEDFKLLQEIYKSVGEYSQISKLLDFIKRDDILENMRIQIIKNSK